MLSYNELKQTISTKTINSFPQRVVLSVITNSACINDELQVHLAIFQFVKKWLFHSKSGLCIVQWIENVLNFRCNAIKKLDISIFYTAGNDT